MGHDRSDRLSRVKFGGEPVAMRGKMKKRRRKTPPSKVRWPEKKNLPVTQTKELRHENKA
jgi:hypothetical protein